MNTRKTEQIRKIFGSRIAGIKTIYMEEINQKGLIILYRCDNEAFLDNKHIINMFKNSIEMLKTNSTIKIGKIKTKKLNEAYTLTKVLIYD